MSVTIVCDACGRKRDSGNKRGWFAVQTSDDYFDFCTPSCLARWAAEQENAA